MRGEVGALKTGKKHLTDLRTFVGLPAGHSRVQIGQTLVELHVPPCSLEVLPTI